MAPVDDGLGMEILRYAAEIRPAHDYFGELPDIEIDEDMVSLASELISRKSGRFEPEKYRNHYSEAIAELVQKKMKGRKIVATHEPARASATVIDLMEALKKSVQEGESKPRPRKASGKRVARK